MQEQLKQLPRDKHNLHVVVGIPTFGAVSIEFANYLRHLGTPMNCSFSVCHPKGKPVDEARNEIVRYAQRSKAKYIFFMDDDVIGMATDSLIRLLGRDADGSCPIVAGVYCVKQVPPMPLIFKEGHPDGFTDWKFGEFVEVAATGMGCTLIRTDVFDKIPEPWFKTQRRKDPEHPVGKLFDTCTEDFWFCYAARQAGYKVMVDTAVQNFHYDINTGTSFCYNSNLGRYGWYDSKGAFMWYQTLKQKEEEEAKAKELAPPPAATKDGKVRFNLGAGAQKFDGFIGVDENGNADESGDIRDIEWLTKKHGLADQILSCHSLEHIAWPQVMNVLRNWCRGLKPGGSLEISVPDLEWCVNDWAKAPDDDPQKFEWKLAKIFGLCTTEGEHHRGGFSESYLKYMAAQLPLVDVKVETVFDPKLSNQPSIWLRAKKAGVVAEKIEALPLLERIHLGHELNGKRPKKANKAAVRELVAAGGKKQ